MRALCCYMLCSSEHGVVPRLLPSSISALLSMPLHGPPPSWPASVPAKTSASCIKSTRLACHVNVSDCHVVHFLCYPSRCDFRPLSFSEAQQVTCLLILRSSSSNTVLWRISRISRALGSRALTKRTRLATIPWYSLRPAALSFWLSLCIRRRVARSLPGVTSHLSHSPKDLSDTKLSWNYWRREEKEKGFGQTPQFG